MKKIILISFFVFFISNYASAFITNTFEFEGVTANLSIQPSAGDLAQESSGVTNYIEAGNFYLAAWPQCRSYMLFNATNTYNGYGPGAVGGGDNIYDAGILFQDYSICTMRTDFVVAKTVTQIVIYAGHGSGGAGSSRSWINCDIESSSDGTNFVFVGNMKAGRIEENISIYGDGFSNVMARLYDTTETPLAYDVKSLRYIFYSVGWDGDFRPPETGAEATVAREIDVYGKNFAASKIPIADFAAEPTNTPANTTVNFTDLSSNMPTSWLWNFGDGTFTNLQNPGHRYSSTGTFDVVLICSNSQGSDTNSKTGYITITKQMHMYGLGVVAPGVWHTNYFINTADGPVNMNIAIVELNHPAVEVEVALANDSCYGTERVSSMARRKGAVLGVNGDYWSTSGRPLGLCVVNRQITTAPKYRTSIGFTTNQIGKVQMWSDRWQWWGKAYYEDGGVGDLVMLNLDLNDGWTCLYNDKYGQNSYGSSVPACAEVVIDCAGIVTEQRIEQPGVPIPEGGYIISARGAATNSLLQHATVGSKVRIDPATHPAWQNLQCAITAGPRIVKDGVFYQDPIQTFPNGEDFTISWKQNHYNYRQPRTAAAVSEDGNTLILAVADGRQSSFSVGIYQDEMADILMSYGGYNALDLDSGGSATMVINGMVTNHPSDYANPDGTGGVERHVANSLLIKSTAYDFRAAPRRPQKDMPCSFNDKTYNSPSGWEWNFGDGNTSTQQDPINTYSSPGAFNVSLAVTNGADFNLLTKTNYIKVAMGGIITTQSRASSTIALEFQPENNDALQVMISNGTANATIVDGGFCGALGSLSSFTDSTNYGDYGLADFGRTGGSILKGSYLEAESVPSQVVRFDFSSSINFTNIFIFGGADNYRGCINVDVEFMQNGSTEKVFLANLKSADVGSYFSKGTDVGTENNYIVAAASAYGSADPIATDVSSILLTFYKAGNPGDPYFISALDEEKPYAVAGSIIKEIDINSTELIIPEPFLFSNCYLLFIIINFLYLKQLRS